MFVLQRAVFRTVRPRAPLRTNSTLASSESKSTSSTSATVVPDAPTAGRRKYKLPTKRPDISNANPRAWNRPLAPGVIPAYDLALEVLKKDSLALKQTHSELKKRIEETEKQYQVLLAKEGGQAAGETSEAYALDQELERMREELHIVEVQSEVNLPEVRWKVANAMADMNIPSHRHLVEQRWRGDGDLDLLMERIYQMKVVPDVLPDIRPTVDLRVVTHDVHKKTSELLGTLCTVEPGSYVSPKQTVEQPRLHANVFHSDTRLYTLMLVDPDVPNEETASYATYLHWLQPNVPLSASSSASKISGLNAHTPYIPPHPQRGTPYHRYTLLLLPQPPLTGEAYTRNTEARAVPGVPTSKTLDVPVVKDEERYGFDVRAFCEQWGLDATKGGAVHMFRQVWSEDVSKIYKDILKVEEPRYGRVPKYDPYAELKHRKKYSL